MNPKGRALTEKNLLFTGMDFASVEYMLEHSAIRDLAAGEKLLQPDIQNHYVYLILEGKLSIHLNTQETLEHTSLVAGECVGEISLVDGKPPSALVVAAEPTRVLSVPHETVWLLVERSHEVALNLLGILAGRMRHDQRELITSQDKKAQFEHQACVDALTGVHNRHWMEDAFPRALHRCVLNKLPFAIMMVDIDHFKRVNDTYGHLVGDIALKTVARCMTKNFRPHDLLVRYGGEEFAVLLPDTDLEEAMIVAERLRTRVADTVIHHDALSFQVTISIGIARTQLEEKLETLIGEADRALYRAKELGRTFPSCVLLDRAHWHALVWDVVVFTPRGQLTHEAAIGVGGIHARVPSNLLEIHRVDVTTGGQQFCKPAHESQEAHSAAFKSLRLEMLGATGDRAVQLVQCPASVRAQIKGKNGAVGCRVHRHCS